MQFDTSEFVSRCAFIATHISSLRSLLLFIQLTVPQALNVIYDPGNQDWIKAVNKIGVKSRFSFKVLVSNGPCYHSKPSPADMSLTTAELNRLGEKCRMMLEKVLMPDSLKYGNIDESGLSKLFEEEMVS